ncbi:hypothetical protein ACN47E_004928 [Coniothyrium glycines]
MKSGTLLLEDSSDDDIPLASIERHREKSDRLRVSPVASVPARAESKLTADPKPAPPPRKPYPVPKELEGVKKALGSENWEQYILLMEQLWAGVITGEEFGAKTKSIFLMFDERMKKRLNNLVARHIVVPMFDERADDEARRAGASSRQDSVDKQ